MKYIGLTILIYAIGALVYGASIRQPIRVQNNQAVATTTTTTTPYWTDPVSSNDMLLHLNFEQTNTLQTLDVANWTNTASPYSPPAGPYHFTNMPSVATGPTRMTEYSNSLGRAETYYRLDGSDDYFYKQDSTNINLTTNFTFAFWVRPQETARGDIISVSQFILIQNYPATNQWDLYTLPAGELVSVTRFQTNVWYHYCFTISNNTQILYINGLAEKTNTYVHPGYALGTYIGRQAAGLESKSDIDDVRIYPTALGQPAISNIFYYTHPTNNMEAR